MSSPARSHRYGQKSSSEVEAQLRQRKEQDCLNHQTRQVETSRKLGNRNDFSELGSFSALKWIFLLALGNTEQQYGGKDGEK
jgi:hypothetical protein